MPRRILSALAVLALAACATPTTVYQSAASPDESGWRQTRIEADRYRVSFRANPDLKAPQVEDLALRRAAEITLEQNYDWFRVVNRMVDQVGGRQGGGTSVGVGGSTGSFGSGIGVGVGFDLSGDTRRYEATLEVQLGRDPKPAEATAYNARDVLASQPR